MKAVHQGQPALLLALLCAENLPTPTPEYRFASPRRWRFDLAYPERRIAIEIEGGIWTQGRHTRGKGYLGDIEKYNTAAILGWRVIRVTYDMIASGSAVKFIKQALAVSAPAA